MLSLHFLLVASHCHFLSVLDLCVFVCCCPDFPRVLCRHDWAHLRRGCFIQRGLQIQRLLHASALVSELFQVLRRKHNVHGKYRNTNQLVGTHGGVAHTHLRAQQESLKRQHVDDHQATGAQSPL